MSDGTLIKSRELSKVERSRLDKCEQVIETGLASFVEVGNAMAEIQEDKLYRDTHKTFEQYLKERFGLSRAYAYRLIGAAKTVELSPMGDKILNERIARELSDVPPKQHRKIFEEVEKRGPVTTNHVAEVVAKYAPARRRVPNSAPVKDTRVYLCLDYEDAEWSAQEIARALSGHAEFIRELIDALEEIVDSKE